MTRQRGHRRAPGGGVTPEELRAGEAALGPGIPPAELREGLATADAGTRLRAMGALQAGAGNGAVEGLIGCTGHAAGLGMGLGALTTTPTQVTVSRDLDETEVAGPSEEPVPLDTAATTDVIESVGPVAESSYAVEASSLADVAAVIGGRPEAGHVDWAPSLEFHQTGGTIDRVVITVGITLDMPSWTPPSTMLPKARAEWTRWYAALRAHEQGHIDLVHEVFDGLAQRILGKRVRTGDQLFETARTSLARKSRAYDTRTGHGTKQGTVMDVSIEQREIDEEQRKQEEAERKKGRESAVPDVGDEQEE